jgi:RNA-directed DNA polymerase
LHIPPKGMRRGPYALVKYADDRAVFSPTQGGAVETRHRLSQWLGARGLRWPDEKTQIRHFQDGVNFLGVTIRRWPTPKSSRSGDKLLMKPRQDAITQLKGKRKGLWRAHVGAPAVALINRIYPVSRAGASTAGVARPKRCSPTWTVAWTSVPSAT